MKCSLQKYLTRKKMELAKALMLKDKKNVTQTAEILHYSSIHNFSRAFKKHFGISPCEVKLLAKNN